MTLISRFGANLVRSARGWTKGLNADCLRILSRWSKSYRVSSRLSRRLVILVS